MDCCAMSTTPPTESGIYEFRGTLLGGQWFEPKEFPDWVKVKLFFNTKTQRANAQVLNADGAYSDFVGQFLGEWRTL